MTQYGRDHAVGDMVGFGGEMGGVRTAINKWNSVNR